MTASFRILGFLLLLLAGIAPAHSAPDLQLATTTSTENSGLLNAILPLFEAKYDTRVRVVSVGSGKAMKLGENGDVDVVLVHSRADEEKFVAAGFGVNRRDVMYNDFIIVGPKSDPAGIRGNDVVTAFKKIAAAGSGFVSRGDDSGTQKWSRVTEGGRVEHAARSVSLGGIGNGRSAEMERRMRDTHRRDTTQRTGENGLEKWFGRTKCKPYGVMRASGTASRSNHGGAMRFIECCFTEGRAAIAAFRGCVQLFSPARVNGYSDTTRRRSGAVLGPALWESLGGDKSRLH